MIIVQTKLRRFFPYRLIYWPTAAALKEFAENLPPTHYARVESADIDLQSGRCIVSHHLALTLLIDLRSSLDAIYKDLIDNARIRIHKGERLGSRLALRRYAGGPDQDRLVPEFGALYNDFARGKPSQVGPISMAREFSLFPNSDLIMAYLDGEPICGHLNLVDREAGIVRLLYSANKRFHNPPTARLAGIVNVYLHWHELERYREEGLATYDFGSIGQMEDSVGVNRFKMQFGGTIVCEHNYILAGMPMLWRSLFNLTSLLGGRWHRRDLIHRAGERWRDMSPERIRETVEDSIEDYERRQRNKRRDDSAALATRIMPDRDASSVNASKNKNLKASQQI
jgi:hypothetical protein